jgi:hypothetical protein
MILKENWQVLIPKKSRNPNDPRKHYMICHIETTDHGDGNPVITRGDHRVMHLKEGTQLSAVLYMARAHQWVVSREHSKKSALVDKNAMRM